MSEELRACRENRVVLGLEQSLNLANEFMVSRMVRLKTPKFGGCDDRVLMLAQDVLDLSRQSNKTLGALILAFVPGLGR